MEKMKTLFRNASIATVGLARGQRLLRRIVARRNHQGVLAQASTDGGSVAKLVIAAVAVLVGLALVIGAMRKA
ncbi:hypothetical protein [Pseudomonas aeruginosa]|uniref:hypothetical protein n=1 Tax=Pseudomonas aeruginosa TaxID=287 RepID=UPI0034A57457